MSGNSGSWDELESAAKRAVAELDGEGVWFDVACGVAGHGHPLAVAVSSVVGGSWSVVRAEVKGRGTERRIEGAQLSGLDRPIRVALIHDGTTDEATLRSAMTAVQVEEAEIVAIVGVASDGLVTVVLGDGFKNKTRETGS